MNRLIALLWSLTPMTAAVALPAAPPSTGQVSADTAAGWPAYGGDAGGTRYSPLAQITPANVGELRVAWTSRTGELGGRQFVVIAAGGYKGDSTRGDFLVAYALPR